VGVGFQTERGSPRALARRLRNSRTVVKITRYLIGSVVALATSVLVFALMLDLGFGTTICSIVAFVAGAVPNWILNRRWAWQITGRVEFGREIVGYVAVSVASLVASSVGTGLTQHWVRAHVDHGFRLILVTGAYVLVQGLLFGAKYLIYERWIFAGRSRLRAALRSRHQVWATARANRTP
jgi:putative flippase GtrA